MAKVFEGEVSKSLNGLGYRHKCPDHPHATPDKVDFLMCYKSRFVGIEAKETTNISHAEHNIVTPNQYAALRSIHESGGLALVLINFDRKRGVGGRVGFCVAFDHTSFDAPWRYELEQGTLIARVAGGWDIRAFLERIYR